MAKNRNTFQKTQREMEKKRKNEQKRTEKKRKKELPSPPVAPADATGADEEAAE